MAPRGTQEAKAGALVQVMDRGFNRFFSVRGQCIRSCKRGKTFVLEMRDGHYPTWLVLSATDASASTQQVTAAQAYVSRYEHSCS